METIGDATLYHVDCAEVLPLLPLIDAVVTDPPYGLGDKLHRPGPGKWSKLYGDGAPTWDRETHPMLYEYIAKARDAIVWGGNYYDLPPRRGWLIWDKIVREFSSGHVEMAWTTIDQPTRAFNFSNGQLANEGKYHPTQKPAALMAWCLSFLPKAQIICDPFMGSGTTGVACANLGRSFIGVEQDPKHFATACERIAAAYAQGRLFA